MANPAAPAPGSIALGSLPSSFAPSSGAQFGQALGELPELVAQRQLQRSQTEDAQHDLLQKRLAQLATVGKSQPGAANNPFYVRQVQQVYQQLGLPVPRTNDGMIDINALAPKRQWSEIPDDQRLKGLALPPEARNAMFSDVEGVPEEYQKAPLATALSAAAQEGAQRMVAQRAVDLANGKLTPGEFAGIVKANSSALGDSAQYYLSDDFLQNTLSAAGAANIAKLDSLGIHYKNMDTLRSRWQDQQLDEFRLNLGEKTRMDTGKLQQMAQTNAYRTQLLTQAQQRIDQGNQRLQIMLQNSNALVSRTQVSNFATMLKPVLQTYHDTLRLYTQTNGQIQAALNSGVTPDQKLLDTQIALKQSLDNMAPMVQEAQGLLSDVPASAASAVTGQRIVPGKHSGLPAAYLKGKPIYLNADGTGYVFADGSPAK